MDTKSNTTKTTFTGLLVAIAIIIPMIMPIKVAIGPASFTLASHVAIFLAMFFSPSIAVITALGAAMGFFIAGFPLVIVMRALSHVLFAFVGALALEKNGPDDILASLPKSQLFSFIIALLHALGETLIVTYFFYGGLVENTTDGYFYTVFLIVGVGTLIHSMVDFMIAQYIWNAQADRLKALKVRMSV